MPQSDLKPYLTIPLLEVCNFKCVYCPPEGETYHTPKAVFAPEKICGILDTAQAVGMPKVRFSGGEPLLYKHLEAVIAHALRIGLTVHMNTNGYLLEKHLPWLKNYSDLVIKVSLDVVTEEALQAVAKVKRIHKILNGLRMGVEAGLVKRVNFVLTRLNVDQVPDIIALCKELKIGLKIFDMYPVPETEPLWHTFFAPVDILGLSGEPLPTDPYTLKFGTPTTEWRVDGVHVRVKNCFNGTRYHKICETCPAFPCPEGFYCLQVTPSMTVVPCRLGTHLYLPCQDLQDFKQALQKVMAIYAETYHLNAYGPKYEPFRVARLAELQGGDVVEETAVPALTSIPLPLSPTREKVRC